MKDRVHTLAVSGATLAFLFAVISFSLAFQFAKLGEFAPPPGTKMYDEMMAKPIAQCDIPLFIPAALSALGGALGILAAVFVEKRPGLSGFFLITASVVSFFTIIGIIPTILYIIGGMSSLSINTENKEPPKPKQDSM